MEDKEIKPFRLLNDDGTAVDSNYNIKDDMDKKVKDTLGASTEFSFESDGMHLAEISKLVTVLNEVSNDRNKNKMQRNSSTTKNPPFTNYQYTQKIRNEETNEGVHKTPKIVSLKSVMRAVVGIFVVLLILLFFLFTTFFSKKDFNLLSFYEPQWVGISEYGTLELTTKYPLMYEEKDVSNDVLTKLLYTIEDNGSLNNEDKITIHVDKNNPILKKYKYKVSTDTYTFSTQSFREMPEQWNDIKNPNTIIDDANQVIQTFQQTVKESLESTTKDKYQRTEIVQYTNATLENIYYKTSSLQTCHENLDNNMLNDLACGTVAFIYSYELLLPPGATYVSSDGKEVSTTIYELIMYTNITTQNDHDKVELYFEEYNNEKVLDAIVARGHEKSDIEHVLEQEGFKKS